MQPGGLCYDALAKLHCGCYAPRFLSITNVLYLFLSSQSIYLYIYDVFATHVWLSRLRFAIGIHRCNLYSWLYRGSSGQATEGQVCFSGKSAGWTWEHVTCYEFQLTIFFFFLSSFSFFLSISFRRCYTLRVLLYIYGSGYSRPYQVYRIDTPCLSFPLPIPLYVLGNGRKCRDRVTRLKLWRYRLAMTSMSAERAKERMRMGEKESSWIYIYSTFCLFSWMKLASIVWTQIQVVFFRGFVYHV